MVWRWGSEGLDEFVGLVWGGGGGGGGGMENVG